MPKSTRDSWNRFSLTALESNRSYWCLDFTFSASRTMRQYTFLLFKPPYLWCLVFASLGYEYSSVCVCVCVCVCAHSVTFDSLQPHGTVTHQAFLSMGFSWRELLEWVAISCSSGSSWSKDQIRVFCIAGRFFTNWATTRKYSFTVDYGCKGLKLKAEKTVLKKNSFLN